MIVCMQYLEMYVYGDQDFKIFSDSVLLEWHPGCPIWGTSMLPFLGDIQVALFGGHSDCPFWGTFRLSFLRDIQVALSGDIQVALFGGHSTCPFCLSIRLSLCSDVHVMMDLFNTIQIVLIEWHSGTSILFCFATRAELAAAICDAGVSNVWDMLPVKNVVSQYPYWVKPSWYCNEIHMIIFFAEYVERRWYK